MNNAKARASKEKSRSGDNAGIKRLGLMLSCFVVPWIMGLLTYSRIVGSTNPSNMAFVGTTSLMAAAGVLVAYFVCLCRSAWHKDVRKVIHFIVCIAVAVILWQVSAESRKFETVFAAALNRRLCDLNVEEFRNRCTDLLDKIESGEIEHRSAYTHEKYMVLESVDLWLPAKPSDLSVFDIRNSTNDERAVVVQWSAFMHAYGVVFRHSTTDEKPPRFRLQAKTYPTTEKGIYMWAGIRSHGSSNTQRLREKFANPVSNSLADSRVR